MTIVVNHRQMAEVLGIAFGTKTSYFISGPTGIGKSVSIKELAKKKAEERKRKFVEWNKLTRDEKFNVMRNTKQYFAFIDQRALQFDLGSFQMPDLFKNVDVEGLNGTFEWRIPLVYAYLCMPDTEGFLFFDEFNQAPTTIQGMFYQIINDRQIGEHKIADGVFIIGAGNRMEDKANVFDMATPLKDRLEHLELGVPSVEEWTEDFAIPHGIDMRIVGFLQFKQSFLNMVEPDSSDMAFPTPRGNERLSNMIKNIETKPENLRLLEIIVGSNVGETYAAQFVKWLTLMTKIKLSDFLDNPKRMKDIKTIFKLKDDDAELEYKYAICIELPEVFKKDKKMFTKIMNLIEYVEPELACITLRYIKDIDPQFFVTNAVKFEYIHNYGKYLL